MNKLKEKFGQWYIVPVDALIMIVPFIAPLQFTTYVSYFLAFMSIMSLIGLTIPETRAKAIEHIKEYTAEFRVYDILTDIAFILIWGYFGFYFLTAIYMIGKVLLTYLYYSEVQ
jgi:hypothetical protein